MMVCRAQEMDSSKGCPRDPPSLAASLSWNHPAIRSSLGTAGVTHVKTTKPTANFLTQNHLESRAEQGLVKGSCHSPRGPLYATGGL